MGLCGASRWQQEWERGRFAHPHVALSRAAFDEHLDGLADPSASPLAHAEDLFLACACARGLPAALASFDALLDAVPGWVRRVDDSPDFADEVRQRLRERLLVRPEGGGAPRIAEYSGAGTLRAWLRIAAARTALNLRRNRDDRPMAPLELADGQEPALAAFGTEPELQALRGERQDALRRALRDAFLWLSREERTALRLQYGASLTTEQIATALQTSRATAVRRLSQARTRLLGETRRLLGERLRLSPAEIDSFIDASREGLELSLTGLLRTTDQAPPGVTA
jgi:RNA polymerase sigma-70 factor (ECF subfamily)